MVIMRDYKPEHGSYEDKLGRAIGYLKEKGIWRGSSTCNHRYKNSDGRVSSLAANFFQEVSDEREIRI